MHPNASVGGAGGRRTSPSPREPWEGASPRRRFLKLVGAAPFALCGAWLVACGTGEQASDRPDRGAPKGAGSGEAGPPGRTGVGDAGSSAAETGGGSADGGGAATADALVTEIDAMRPTVEALQYINQTGKPDQRCANCQLYTAKTGSRGSCQIFPQGVVAADGWCASWVKKTES